jgi:molecular chaperone DnaJ
VTKRDYYEILGVVREADDGALKSAYRKLALQFHPDRNPDDADAEEKFKEAAEAYSVLSDPQKRAAYNHYGHAGVQGASSQGFNPENFADFSDIFGDFFNLGDLFGGGSRQRNRVQRGEDVRYDLEIDFEDVMRGKSVDVQVPRTESCGVCGGTGGDGPDGLTTCSICRGRGEVIYQQSFLSVRRTCSQCGGRGKLIRRACKECRGAGQVRKDRRLKINVPAGVDNGTRLRLQAEGQPGPNGGPPGDLYVFLRVKEHAIFERHEDDLHCTVPVNIAQAALGTDVQVLTFDGLESVKVPEGTQHAAQIKLRGLGIPHVNGSGRGDLFVNIEVTVPGKLTREQRKLLEQLRDTLPVENEPKEKGIFDKVKDYFM